MLMQAVLRLVLVAAVLVVAVALIVAHGTRGIALLVAIGLLAYLPRTRAWRAIERPLVRLTGSRRRAAVVVMLVIITAVAAFNLWELLH